VSREIEELPLIGKTENEIIDARIRGDFDREIQEREERIRAVKEKLFSAYSMDNEKTLRQSQKAWNTLRRGGFQL
jgi:hypothetical protein